MFSYNQFFWVCWCQWLLGSVEEGPIWWWLLRKKGGGGEWWWWLLGEGEGGGGLVGILLKKVK